MQTRNLLPVLLLSLVTLVTGCSDGTVASPSTDARADRATPVTATDDAEPAYDCREVDGTEVCDTFDETDEGPGTDRVPDRSDRRGAAATAPLTDPAPTEPASSTPAPAESVPSTRGPAETGHDEGPGTGSLPGTRRDCREVSGRQVCDTFGEGDEGPGTYDDRDEGPGTTG